MSFCCFSIFEPKKKKKEWKKKTISRFSACCTHCNGWKKIVYENDEQTRKREKRICNQFMHEWRYSYMNCCSYIKHSQIIKQHQTLVRCLCYAQKSQHNISCSFQFENTQSWPTLWSYQEKLYFLFCLRNVRGFFCCCLFLFVQLKMCAHYYEIDITND